jgi:HD superfamily phosphohydrolase
MHIAGLVAESLSDEIQLENDVIQEIRLAALLHDVGHGPFSHLFEEVLEKTNLTHEDVSQRIVRETPIRDTIEKNGFSSRRISDFCVGKLNDKPFLNEIIAGGLSADIMDYVPRDSYFTGVEYGKVDIHRIIDSLHVINGHLALENAALYAFEALLIARYEMFKAVYFHRTVRAAELMLVHSMSLADESLRRTDLSDINRHLKLTDEIVFEQLINLPNSPPNLRTAKKLAQDYGSRRLLKCCFEKLMQRKDRVVEKIFTHQRFRQELAHDISEKAHVSIRDVYVDVPTTPSVPYTYAREQLDSIILTRSDYTRKYPQRVPIEQLPLVGSIAGFMDILRVYTTSPNRSKVTKAVGTIFGDDSFVSQVSV